MKSTIITVQKAVIGIILLCVVVACQVQAVEETTPTVKNITETIYASGILEVENAYQITARTEGYLQDMRVEINNLVEAGQLVAVVENTQNIIQAEKEYELYNMAKKRAATSAPQLQQAQNETERAQQNVDYYDKQLERYKKLLAASSIPRIDYEQVEIQYQNAWTALQNAKQNYQEVQQQAEQELIRQRAQKNLAATASTFNNINAWRAGRILKKHKEIGDYVRAGEAILTVGDLRQLHAKVNIDENSIAKVKVGQRAWVQMNANSTKVYQARVEELLPTYDEESQSFIGKLYFLDKLDFRYESAQLEANIIVDTIENALLIPRTFLNYNQEVYVKGEERPTKVKIGIIGSEWVQVTSGIGANTVLTIQNLP